MRRVRGEESGSILFPFEKRDAGFLRLTLIEESFFAIDTRG